MRFDWKQLSTRDRVVVCFAAIAFISLFLPWWGFDVLGFSLSVDGWSAGITAWGGCLILTAAGVLLALRRSGTAFSPNVKPAMLVAGVATLGLLLVVIRWASLPRADGHAVGARYGLYIALIAGIVEVTVAVLELRAPEEPARVEPTADAPTTPEE
jgi:hypothetical protein